MQPSGRTRGGIYIYGTTLRPHCPTPPHPPSPAPLWTRDACARAVEMHTCAMKYTSDCDHIAPPPPPWTRDARACAVEMHIFFMCRHARKTAQAIRNQVRSAAGEGFTVIDEVVPFGRRAYSSASGCAYHLACGRRARAVLSGRA